MYSYWSNFSNFLPVAQLSTPKGNFGKFWAKTTRDGRPGISVFEHMLNVGYVGRKICNSFPELLNGFRVSASLVSALDGLDDVVKNISRLPATVQTVAKGEMSI